MPLFLDSHDVTGATPEAIADAHLKDVAVQGRYGVRYVKHWLNDARGRVFCLCEAPDAAIRCASTVHAALRDPAHRAGEPLRIRVGIAAGEPIERNGDFFGSTVQLAARLCMQAAPSQTLVSTSVAELCGHRRLTDVGELTLKGFPHAVRAHAVVDEA